MRKNSSLSSEGQDGYESPETPASNGSSSPSRRNSMLNASASLDDIGYERPSSRGFKQVAKAYQQASGGVAQIRKSLSQSSTFHTLGDSISTSYLSFTPGLLHRLLKQDDPQNAMNGCLFGTFVMAVLLIDISGFTKMSVKLGSERTRKHTSSFFGVIMEVIMEHGGDVLKFLGDALLVSWPTDLSSGPTAQRDVAVTAAKCAEAIMKQNNFQIEDDIVLTLHGALAVGTVHTYDVGLATRKEFLIGGSLLAELGQMESEASSGQLVVSQEFLDLMPDGTVSEELLHGHARLIKVATESKWRWPRPRRLRRPGDTQQFLVADEISMQYNKLEPKSAEYQAMVDFAKRSQAALAAHVPVSCREAVENESLAILGEMRWVTTLFLSIDALVPYLNSGHFAAVQSVFCLIVESARSTGGEIRQFVLDDKGCVAIIAWGLPMAAHGMARDTELAVHCALHLMTGFKAMREESGEQNINIEPGPHIGVAAGEAYVGLLGSMYRCEYAMVGPSVNLAARLMGKAPPWHVLVDETVHANAGQTSIEFQKRDPVKAKGYDAKIDVFEPLFETREVNNWGIHRNLVEQWDMLALDFQFVGKVASVLAECPGGGCCDFRLKALVCVLEELEAVSPKQTINAVLSLRTVHILRLTRCASRGNPAYAFTSAEVKEFLAGLLPIEVTARVHYHFAKWLETEIATAESQDSADREAKAAALAMLHHDVDAKLVYHRGLGQQQAQQDTIVGSWLAKTGQTLFAWTSVCCVSRPTDTS